MASLDLLLNAVGSILASDIGFLSYEVSIQLDYGLTNVLPSKQQNN